MGEDVAGRLYPQVYRTQGRAALHGFLQKAIQTSGGRVLYASSASRAPIYLGVQGYHDERVGLLIYPFTANQRVTRNRPPNEHRFQIRYGSEESWMEEHPLGRDVAQVDTTLVLGVHIDKELLVGIDPTLYDPLPMGISFEFKDTDVEEAQRSGWHVYERVNRRGQRREPRSIEQLETVVMFRPERLLDYARLEREASDLGLDPPLRFAAAKAIAAQKPTQRDAVGSLHHLERQFDMSSAEILDMIENRTRLAVAVRGGVAEHHLERQLQDDPDIAGVESLDIDGQPDFRVIFSNGRVVTVECKNASPRRYENGDYRVEVQKTRASKLDPASRYYRVDQFHVVAACLYASTGHWDFAFRASHLLARHGAYPQRIAPMQRIDASWHRQISRALQEM